MGGHLPLPVAENECMKSSPFLSNLKRALMKRNWNINMGKISSSCLNMKKKNPAYEESTRRNNSLVCVDIGPKQAK